MKNTNMDSVPVSSRVMVALSVFLLKLHSVGSVEPAAAAPGPPGTNSNQERAATATMSYISIPGSENRNSSNGDCFKDFPYLKDRFSWEQLDFFCQQKREFDEIIFGQNVPDPFTERQKAYLDKLKIDATKTGSHGIAVRKEIRMLSAREREVFNWALQSLKRTEIDRVSKYDLIVLLAHPTLAPGSHVGAAYLPWHREYLRTFEAALKLEHPEMVGLPYWDSSLDSSLSDPSQSALWTSALLGNSRGQVTSGPFANSRLFLINSTEPIMLFRNSGEKGELWTAEDTRKFLAMESYKNLTACVDPWLERKSRRVQEWVGGTMGNIYYASQDFVYFLHYAFLDKIWEQFRASQTQLKRESDYPSDSEACTKFHYGTAEMRPFGPLKNLDGLKEVYTKSYYRYEDTLPAGCNSNNECGSEFLFCNRQAKKCASKVQIGGDCSGFADQSHDNSDGVCYLSRCSERGQCVSAV